MHIALVEPQIPQNTGSIARTAAALGVPLHIIGDTPFEISEKSVRRAGLDYWPYVKLYQHKTWEDFTKTLQPVHNILEPRFWLFSTKGKKLYTDVSYKRNDILVFGSETRGLGTEFMSAFPAGQIVTVPMKVPEVRSLNLSNTVSIAIYEAIRQLGV